MGTHPNYRGESTQLEYETSRAMQDAWVAFANDPVGGLACEGWESYELGTCSLREFGSDVAAQDVSVKSTEAMCQGAFVKSS